MGSFYSEWNPELHKAVMTRRTVRGPFPLDCKQIFALRLREIEDRIVSSLPAPPEGIAFDTEQLLAIRHVLSHIVGVYEFLLSRRLLPSLAETLAELDSMSKKVEPVIELAERIRKAETPTIFQITEYAKLESRVGGAFPDQLDDSLSSLAAGIQKMRDRAVREAAPDPDESAFEYLVTRLARVFAFCGDSPTASKDLDTLKRRSPFVEMIGAVWPLLPPEGRPKKGDYGSIANAVSPYLSRRRSSIRTLRFRACSDQEDIFDASAEERAWLKWLCSSTFEVNLFGSVKPQIKVGDRLHLGSSRLRDPYKESRKREE